MAEMNVREYPAVITSIRGPWPEFRPAGGIGARLGPDIPPPATDIVDLDGIEVGPSALNTIK